MWESKSHAFTASPQPIIFIIFYIFSDSGDHTIRTIIQSPDKRKEEEYQQIINYYSLSYGRSHILSFSLYLKTVFHIFIPHWILAVKSTHSNLISLSERKSQFFLSFKNLKIILKLNKINGFDMVFCSEWSPKPLFFYCCLNKTSQ